MPSDISEIEKSNCLPRITFADNYAEFIRQRSQLLAAEAEKLIGV